VIPGFEEQTHPLTDKELSVAPVVVAILRKHVGKENAIVNGRIADLCKKEGVTISLPQPRVRKIINYLIHHTHPNICASGNGYYFPRDRYEFEDYLKSAKKRRDEYNSRYDVQEDYYLTKINSSQGKLSV
jgi:hypothetical protein